MVVFATIILFWFIYYLLFYAGRINVLRAYLDKPEINIPANWRALHRKSKPGFYGQGDYFFLGILLSMYGTLITVAYYKFVH